MSSTVEQKKKQEIVNTYTLTNYFKENKEHFTFQDIFEVCGKMREFDTVWTMAKNQLFENENNKEFYLGYCFKKSIDFQKDDFKKNKFFDNYNLNISNIFGLPVQGDNGKHYLIGFYPTKATNGIFKFDYLGYREINNNEFDCPICLRCFKYRGLSLVADYIRSFFKQKNSL